MIAEHQGFCDTNIFVDFSLIDKFLDFIDKYKKLSVSGAVHRELQDWDRENYEYSFIYGNLKKQIELDNIELIERKNFSDLQKLIIDRRLEEIYVKLETLPKEKKKHLNEGEIESAVYAEVTKAPFIQSNDNFPSDLKDNEFKNINFLSRNDILTELCRTLKEVGHYNDLIERNRKKMDSSFIVSKSIEKSDLNIAETKKKELLELKEKLKGN